MPDTFTTQVLIDRVQAGDDAALNDLLRRYQQRVLAAVRIRMGAKLRRKAESWDIVQEVLLGAFRHVKSGDFGTEGALMNYLNKLVQNRLCDEADRQGAQRRDPGREQTFGGRSSGDGTPLIDMADRSAPGPSTVLSRVEDLDRMERAMDALSEEYRELIVAAELEGRTYGELAEEGRFGKTPDAIRMKLTRAMARLAQLYHELEGAEN